MKIIPCPNCGNKKYKVLYKSTLTKKDYDPKVIVQNLKNTLDDYNKHGRIVRCLICQLVYVNPQENIKKLMQGYEDVVDEEYLQNEKSRKSLGLKHLGLIKKYKHSGKIIDIGCFAGFFLELAKKEGWETYGIEPSRWASDIAKKRNIMIIGKDVKKTKLKSNYFDAVTMWDVIEHLEHPRIALKISHRILKDNGIIAIATPDIESLFSKILRSRNPHIIRMHLILFSPKTLSDMLKKEGFEIIHQNTYGRTFPISYFLKRIRFKNVLIQRIKDNLSSFSLLSKIPITLNLGDSFVIIAKKI